MDLVDEPPVSPTPIGGDYSLRATPPLDQRRVVIRLRDGETILIGGAPTYEEALVLAQRTILKLEVPDGEWPMIEDRFINPVAIVSVDVLKWH